MLKDKIEQLRQWTIKTLGGYVTLEERPIVAEYESREIHPIKFKTSCIYESNVRKLSSDYVKNAIGDKIAEALITGNFIHYTVRHEGNQSFITGSVDIIDLPLEEGESKDAKALMEETEMFNPWT